MHAMYHRSHFFNTRSSRVNIQEGTLYFPITYHLKDSKVVLDSFRIPSAMSDSKSLNTSLQEVMISSKNDCVFIRDLSDLILKVIFDTWWAFMNVGSKHSIAWNNCRHAP